MNVSRRQKTGKPKLKPSASNPTPFLTLLDPKGRDICERVADDGIFARLQRLKRPELHVIYEDISMPARLHAQTFQKPPFQFYVVTREWRVSLATSDHGNAEFPSSLLTREPHQLMRWRIHLVPNEHIEAWVVFGKNGRGHRTFQA